MAEAINGDSFVAPRHKNLRTMFYRIQPTVDAVAMVPLPPTRSPFFTNDFTSGVLEPNISRWNALPMPDAATRVDFIDGWVLAVLTSIC